MDISPQGQFIITTIIGFLTLVFTVLAVRRQNVKQELSYEIISDESILTELNLGQHTSGQLQVLFNGKQVDNLHLVTLKIWNSGNQTLNTDDFEKDSTGRALPITFDFGSTSEVLNVEILKTEPAALKNRVESHIGVSLGKVTMEPLLINANEAIIFSFLILQYTTFSWEGRISGKVRKVSNKGILSKNDFFTSFLRSILFTLIIAIITIIEQISALSNIFLSAVLIVSCVYSLYKAYQFQKSGNNINRH